MSGTDVFIELPGEGSATQVGTMRLIIARGRERTSFEYSKEWLRHPPLLPTLFAEWLKYNHNDQYDPHGAWVAYDYGY